MQDAVTRTGKFFVGKRPGCALFSLCICLVCKRSSLPASPYINSVHRNLAHTA